MNSVLAGLAETLDGSDPEASGVAYELRRKAVDAIGRDWGDRKPPMWHPASDRHLNFMARDAYEEYGDKFRHDSRTRGVFLNHLPHLHPDAEAHAAELRQDREVVHPSNREMVSDFQRDVGSPMSEGEPSHRFYLANPTWYHHQSSHHEPNSPRTYGRMRSVDRDLRSMATDPNHPMNPAHSDHEHFLAAHAQGSLGWGVLERPYHY